MGVIRFGDEKTVTIINNIASEEGIKAALSITKDLKK